MALEDMPSTAPERSVEQRDMSASARVVIERGKTEQFENLPERSLALDGYCQGPAIDPERQRYSFDHHDNCVRMVTAATCKQVLDALLLGLDTRGFLVFVNDIDGDTALSVWLIKNQDSFLARPGDTEDVREQKTKRLMRIRDLVASVGGIDAHGPAYPAEDKKLAELFFYGAMKPEGDARRAKTYGTDDLGYLLDACLGNIDALVADTLPYSERPERMYDIRHIGVGDWVLVESNDFVFDLVYGDGYTKGILYNQLPDGSYAYTIGKKSEFVGGFPVGPVTKEGTLLHLLAQREPGWGGGSSIGGAPRNADGSRSRIPPVELTIIIDEFLSR